jgi:tRNA-2-methylthio-N6-dimethylallyladenosine synthase
MSLTYHVKTFGCQMNYSDSERMEAYLQALGFDKVDKEEAADLVIFNTCSIRQKAEDKVYGHLKKYRRLKKDYPNTMVALTGCMARISSSRYSVKRDKLFMRSKALDIVLRIEELPQLARLVRELRPEVNLTEIEEESLTDYFKIDATHDSHATKAQAFVAISNGCDKFCTYCIVPYSRGREKSRKISDIVAEVEKLVEQGCKEVTLIGQTVNSYGLSNYDKENQTFSDIKTEPFVELLTQVDALKSKGLKRVRFTSPHPKDMSDQLIEAMANLETQMPYLHLPVQSGDDATLRRMNRTYDTKRYKEIMAKLREKMPDISVSTDIIVGFCGETDEEFENTYNFFKEMAFEHAYLAQYSERTGTTAARFIKDDIPKDVKKARWHRLNELLKVNSYKANQRFIGRTVEVLVESQEGETCLGRSENFKTVQFQSGKDLIGKFVKVKITGAETWFLEGELV